MTTDLSTPAIQRITRDRLRKALADAGDDCAITIGTGHLRLVLDLLDASPPPPAGSAGGGSSDLAALSAGATPGKLQRHGSHVYGPDPERKLIAQFLNMGATAADTPIEANADLTIALWNDYRSGRLIEAPTHDPAAQGEPVTLYNAPIGTLAPAIGGGNWYKTDRGWKWNGPHGTGSTFPTPGGDWTGKLVVATPAAPRSGSGVTVDKSEVVNTVRSALIYCGLGSDASEDDVQSIATRVLALLQAPRPGETGGVDPYLDTSQPHAPAQSDDGGGR